MLSKSSSQTLRPLFVINRILLGYDTWCTWWSCWLKQFDDMLTDENLTLFTFLLGPSAPPEDLALVDTTSTSLLLRWSEVPAADKNGIIRSYTVRYQAISSALVENTTVYVPRREVNLTGLTKNMNYSVSVLASTDKGDGNYRDPEFFLTNQDGELAFRFPILVLFRNKHTLPSKGVQKRCSK